MGHNLSTEVKVTIEALKSADNETLTGAGVDMAGYEGVMFVVGALKGESLAFSVKAQQDTSSAFGSAADLANTSVAFSTTVGADGLTTLDIRRPEERYVRALVIVPDATSAKPTFCIAIRYGASVRPQSNSGELHSTPAEGTA